MFELCTNFTGLKWGIDFWLKSETRSEIRRNKTVQDSMFGAQNPTKHLERATADLHSECDFRFKICRSTLKIYKQNPCNAILVPGFQPLVNNRCFDKDFRHSFHLTS